MKYVHGVSTEKHLEEKTPLDRAIDEYQRKADAYYQKQLEIEKLPPDVRIKRQQELDQAKAFLEHQRMNAENYASIQAGIDNYREDGRDAIRGSRAEVAEKQAILLAEKHHPTGVFSAMLIASGKVKPSSNHAPHHIVPGVGKVYKTKQAHLARVHLHLHGIRINDPDNGVWLPRCKRDTPHWSMPEARGHLEYHTKNYERWVERKVRLHRSEHNIRMQLKLIGRMLQQDNLPKEAR